MPAACQISWLSKLDLYRALPNRQPKTVADEQADKMMTFGGNPHPVKQIQQGPGWCSSCGKSHQLGNVCSKGSTLQAAVALLKGATPGGKRGNYNPHKPDGTFGNGAQTGAGGGGGKGAQPDLSAAPAAAAPVETTKKISKPGMPPAIAAPEKTAKIAAPPVEAAAPTALAGSPTKKIVSEPTQKIRTPKSSAAPAAPTESVSPTKEATASLQDAAPAAASAPANVAAPTATTGVDAQAPLRSGAIEAGDAPDVQADKFRNFAEEDRATAQKHPVGSLEHHEAMGSYHDSMAGHYSALGNKTEAAKHATQADAHGQKQYQAERRGAKPSSTKQATASLQGGAPAPTTTQQASDTIKQAVPKPAPQQSSGMGVWPSPADKTQVTGAPEMPKGREATASGMGPPAPTPTQKLQDTAAQVNAAPKPTPAPPAAPPTSSTQQATTALQSIPKPADPQQTAPAKLSPAPAPTTTQQATTALQAVPQAVPAAATASDAPAASEDSRGFGGANQPMRLAESAYADRIAQGATHEEAQQHAGQFLDSTVAARNAEAAQARPYQWAHMQDVGGGGVPRSGMPDAPTAGGKPSAASSTTAQATDTLRGVGPTSMGSAVSAPTGPTEMGAGATGPTGPTAMTGPDATGTQQATAALQAGAGKPGAAGGAPTDQNDQLAKVGRDGKLNPWLPWINYQTGQSVGGGMYSNTGATTSSVANLAASGTHALLGGNVSPQSTPGFNPKASAAKQHAANMNETQRATAQMRQQAARVR